MMRMIPSVLVAVLLVATTTTVTVAEDFKVSAKTTSRLATSEMAMYSCVFTNQWTAANHPILYPTGMAHWSPPVVATHDMTYEMWSDGSMASMGVELVAEVCTNRSIERTKMSETQPPKRNIATSFCMIVVQISLLPRSTSIPSFFGFVLYSHVPATCLSRCTTTRPVKLPFWNPNWKLVP
jgi:hypothetical protein